MQLSIIIVNYNVKYFLEHCLLSVMKAVANIDAEILVVDNNSTDGSKNYFAKKFPKVKFYWEKENLGFGKANNHALQYVKGEYVLFLNPDTIVGEDCFTNCLSFFKANQNCGALGVRMIDGAGNFLKESKRGFPNVMVGFYKAIGLANIFPKTFGQYYATHLPENENNAVEVLAGAFMMLSRKVILATNGFDEDFFMYGEDIDLSYRIKNAGFENYYLGETTILHFKGESTTKKSNAYFKHFYGAMKLFVDKHYSQSLLLKLFIYVGVFFRKNIAIVKNWFIKNEEPISITKTLIIGNTTEIYEVKKLLLINEKLVHTMNLNDLIFSFKKLKKLITEHNISNVIFCEADLSYRTMLETIQLEMGNISFSFFATSAKTIIGSNDKNKNGFVIAAKQ